MVVGGPEDSGGVVSVKQSLHRAAEHELPGLPILIEHSKSSDMLGIGRYRNNEFGFGQLYGFGRGKNGAIYYYEREHLVGTDGLRREDKAQLPDAPLTRAWSKPAPVGIQSRPTGSET